MPNLLPERNACLFNVPKYYQIFIYLRLEKLFGENRGREAQENIVVVEYAGQRAGLVVGDLLGELQTVIKPMGKILQNIQGVSGATILGSGDVAVILDVPNLVQKAISTGSVSVMNGGGLQQAVH